MEETAALERRMKGVYGRLCERWRGNSENTILEYVENVCRSPIERILAVEMLDLLAPEGPHDTTICTRPNINLDEANDGFREWYERTSWFGVYGPRTKCAIFPQVRIDRYRVDFYIIAVDQVSYDAGDIDRVARAIVECDGHDYHDRSKEQAAKDKARDRVITGTGLPVYRFTGSEIVKDAQRCVGELEDYLWRQMFGREFPDTMRAA